MRAYVLLSHAVRAYVLLSHTMRAYVLPCQDSNFSTALELAVRFGKTLVIQEMDGVVPVLYPILRGDFISQGEDKSFILD